MKTSYASVFILNCFKNNTKVTTISLQFKQIVFFFTFYFLNKSSKKIIQMFNTKFIFYSSIIYCTEKLFCLSIHVLFSKIKLNLKNYKYSKDKLKLSIFENIFYKNYLQILNNFYSYYENLYCKFIIKFYRK